MESWETGSKKKMHQRRWLMEKRPGTRWVARPCDVGNRSFMEDSRCGGCSFAARLCAQLRQSPLRFVPDAALGLPAQVIFCKIPCAD